jgi:hypothetical protein
MECEGHEATSTKLPIVVHYIYIYFTFFGVVASAIYIYMGPRYYSTALYFFFKVGIK